MKRYMWSFWLWFVLVSVPSYGAKTLVFCAESSPASFNPQLVPDGASLNNTIQIFNRLMQFKLGETYLEPALAESWDPSPDGLTYTFHLRKDVSFHKTKNFTPTRKFNADDVLFSVNRQRQKDHPFHKVGGGLYEWWDSMGMNDILKNVEKVDDYTVKFILNRPEATFISDIAMDFMSIQSKEYADQIQKSGNLEQFDIEPVGTGPYIFVRYDKDQTVRYIANDQYFRGRPKIDNLIFSISPDASVRSQKLKTDECQIDSNPALADLDSLAANPKLTVAEQPSLNVSYLALNVTKKPLDNILVRQAINHALNKQSYRDAIFLGHAIANPNPLPPGQWGYNKQIKDYDYNPAKAKELLKKAGFPKGFTTEMWTMPVSRPYNPNGKRMGEMMQADLAKVGITTKLVTFDWPTYVTQQKLGKHTMLQIGWLSDNADPDNFLSYLLSCAAVKGGANNARWCYKPFDQLVEKAKRITNQNQRAKLYEKAQVIFHEQVPWVVLGTTKIYRAYSKKVLNYRMDAFGHDPLEQVDMAP